MFSFYDGDQHGENDAQTESRVLGDISFPTTTKSAQAQKAFIEGMLLLHLFEYELAQEKFHQAQEFDPGFSMSYWGEAMTYNHPIWDEQERESAIATLARLGDSPEARQSSTPSQKEKDYLAALDLLYGAGSKGDRDRAYMQHMLQMASNYPDDHEVQLFYALSIFGASAGVRDVPAYMRSTAISQSVFFDNRNHPGAAHYLIHGVDDPTHAPLGLEAARALAIMAPDAGHAQHMTSHIFTAVGMWDDVVSANESAILVQNRMRVSRDLPARYWGHYNFWLLYGLLQQGRHNEAATLLRAAYKEAVDSAVVPEDPLQLDPNRSQIGSLVQMWARYMIETHGKDREMAGWTFNMGEAFDPMLTYHYIQALDASYWATPAKARKQHNAFRVLKDQLRAIILAMERQAPTDLVYLDRLSVMDLEIQAVIALAEENSNKALEYAREASQLESEMPVAFGPPFVDLPSAELLGGILMQLGLYDQAVDAFKTQGERTHLKVLPMLALARAQEALGNKADAAFTRKTLTSIWLKADPEIRAQIIPE